MSAFSKAMQVCCSRRLACSTTRVLPLDRADEALQVLHSKDGDPLRVIVRPDSR